MKGPVSGFVGRIPLPESVCTFKRGGKCVKHGTIGMRKESTRKVWTKLKGGLFGYKYVKNITYTCNVRNSPVEKPIGRNSPTRKLPDTALGGKSDDKQGNWQQKTEISVDGINRAGANTVKEQTKT